MTWDFSTEPGFQKELDWIEEFTREEIEPLDYVLPNPYDIQDPIRRALVPPLQSKVRERQLWALHLRPELGGQGYGQLQMALVNEIIGRTHAGPIVFGCQAPDSGNAEILAKYGTKEQKERFLEPLLENQIVSCFSMTEPQGGSDPKQFRLRAELDGDSWVLNGEKWFSSNARLATFFITMAVTEPDSAPYNRLSAFLVPADTPGVNIVRNVSVGNEHGPDAGSHAYIRYENVRLSGEYLLGGRGEGFVVAQTRLGGGRMHHAMRAVGLMKRAMEMMGERALIAHDARRSSRQKTACAREDRPLLDGDRGVPTSSPPDRLENRPGRRLLAGAKGHCCRKGNDARGCPQRRLPHIAGSRLDRNIERDDDH